MGREILHETLHCAGLRGGACRLRNEGNGNAGLSGKMQKTPFSSWFSAHRAEKCKNRRFHRSFWGSPRFSVSLRKQNRNKHFFCNRDGTPSKKFAVPQKFHDEAQANNLPESHTDLRQTRRSRVARRRSCAPICHCCAPICHLPPEGRHVYRPRDGMFTARGTACLPPEGR